MATLVVGSDLTFCLFYLLLANARGSARVYVVFRGK